MARRKTFKERFWDRIIEQGDCLIWTGGKDKDGYGKFNIKEKGRKTMHLRTHRVAYEVYVGSIPEGMLVCHTCDNPSCCNPDHLWLGFAADNNRDTREKGRINPAKGDNHWRKKSKNHPSSR